MSQTLLAKRLDAIVEDCVNAVGVDVNTASAALLTRVAGLSAALAQNIVDYRDENGRFESRSALKKCRVWGLKRLNSVPASYALWMAKTRSTLQRCTQKRIRW